MNAVLLTDDEFLTVAHAYRASIQRAQGEIIALAYVTQVCPPDIMLTIEFGDVEILARVIEVQS